jgi:predicted  nucleic acid-binding Zn-ribbon protein
LKDVIDKLYDLQKIDSELDSVVSLRGDLPEKVTSLESEMELVKDKRDQFNEKYEEIKKEIKGHEDSIVHEKDELVKDEKHLYDVTNNKEYDAITIQIKNRKSTMEVSELDILELQEKEEQVKVHVDKYNAEYDKEVEELNRMKDELHGTISETETKEKKLISSRKKSASAIDAKYIKAYDRVRTSKKNAVTIMQRNSCTGCRQVLPRQQQAQILKQESIVHCESCGRIVISDLENTETQEA